jgi:hypothetical protein
MITFYITEIEFAELLLALQQTPSSLKVTKDPRQRQRVDADGFESVLH